MAGFYLIKSRLSGLVLDIEGGSASPGAKVIPWHHNGNDNQLWYDDPITGTIRSKLNHFCLDVEGDRLVVKPYQPGDQNQQWERFLHQIRNRTNRHRVLDVFSNNKDPGAHIGSYDFNGGENQLWEFEFIGPKRRFYIVSEMNDKVLDIKGANADSGAKVITWGRHGDGQKNQLWYLGHEGCIRSALNHMTFENSEDGGKLKMKSFSDDPRGHWTIDGKKIVNGVGECLDIKGAKNDDGASLVSYAYKGSANQHWRIDFV